jgi:DNA-binding CsgD family transcriptional regulator
LRESAQADSLIAHVLLNASRGRRQLWIAASQQSSPRLCESEAERARAELRASGERLRPRKPAAHERLTPQELQVSLAAAEGLTNKEIGARLFLSPKTVEFHLGRAYRKLDVRSRAELIKLFAEHATAAKRLPA